MTTELQTLESLGLQNKENLFEGFFSYKPSWLFTQFINRHERIICLFTGNQRGKCLKKDSKVLLSNGLYKEIRNVDKGDTVLTLSPELKIVPSRVLNRIDSGQKRLIKIITRSGRSISVSEDHPFFTINGWVNVSLIKIGDYIATPREVNILRSEADKEQWEYILLGYLLGDGGLTSSVSITNTDPVILNEIQSLLKEGFFLKPNKNGDITYRITAGKKSPNGFYIAWLRKLQLFGVNSFLKHVPDFVFTSTNKSIGVFLSRLFSCDGWIDNDAVGYCSVSKQLITDVQRLLLRFGITTKVRFRKVKYIYKGIKQDKFAYDIKISRYSDLVKFSSYVGIFSKEEKLIKLLNKRIIETSKENADIIPMDIKYLYKEIDRKKTGKKGKVPYSDQDKFNLLRSSRGKSITRGKLSEIASTFNDERLKELSCSDIYWDKVIRIEDDGIDKTYDLEIEGTHNFIANDIFAHNTSLVAYSYVMRIMGMHPIEAKNMRPNKKIRTYRFASESLPADADRDEQVRNTQYPEFKKWLPPCLIKKDITARSPVITLFDPQGGPDVNIEFVSFNQSVQSQAGQKRASVWIDESANKEFYEEQLPRLLASDGDLIYTLTPAEYVGFEFDEFFEKASIYIREQAVCDRMFERTGKKVKRIEKTDSDSDVAVLMAATDGNPIYPDLVAEKNINAIELIKQGNHPTVFKVEDYQPVTVNNYIGEIIGTLDDETIDIRRYGLFRQSSGQIFKDFDVRIHVISASKYFTEGVPHGWVHARGIDYHEHVPWAVGFLAISPQNEVFVYDELNPSPEKMVTLQIAQIIANKSRDFKFKLNLIDPLAAKKQSNTGLSTIDDLNRIFSQLRKEGICTGGYWQSWDTRSTRGREEVRSRLRNSKLVGAPFSNRVVKNGVTEYLPTLWMLDNCYHFKESFKNWRREEWANRESLLTKDEKDQPQQRYSHFPMVMEALFKHPAFSSGRYKDQFVKDRDTKHKHYFQGEAYG